jgi:RNA polymerase sigma-70 factor (ECF subfamily)
MVRNASAQMTTSEDHVMAALNVAPPGPHAERSEEDVVNAPASEPAASVTRVASVAPGVRLREMIDRHYDTVWRTVRFLGVPYAHAEDVAQQVFCVAARKLDGIDLGAELGFLLATAWRVASEHRRAARRRPVASDGDEVDTMEAPLPSPEQLLDQKRARAVLQEVLDEMPADLRIVFVLYEIEELTLPEIATATGGRLGTLTSRLRRARAEFKSIVKRRRAAAAGPRGVVK